MVKDEKAKLSGEGTRTVMEVFVQNKSLMGYLNRHTASRTCSSDAMNRDFFKYLATYLGIFSADASFNWTSYYIQMSINGNQKNVPKLQCFKLPKVFTEIPSFLILNLLRL